MHWQQHRRPFTIPMCNQGFYSFSLMSPQVVDRVTAAQERLDFGEAGRAMYDFFWSQFADWYIEAAKTRLYGGDAAVARSTRAVRPVARAVKI